MKMEWLRHMNDALSYIEDNLDSEISTKKAAQLARCSQYHFQRMFSYVIGVPLSEYLRRRRLTKAAFDLQNGDKVIDVALRYGYDSPTAFNRAFQITHGISPSAAQKSGTSLKAFPPISLQITVKGVTEMDYRIVEKEGFRAVGIRKKINASPEEFINVEFTPDEENLVIGFMERKSTDLLGLYLGDDDDSGGYYYLCCETDAPVPKDMVEINVPKHTWAVFPGVDELPQIEELFRRIYSEWQPVSDYDFSTDIEMEVSGIDPDNEKFEIWLPVVKNK
jgi:AraC family transcriptional regulator